MRPEYSVLFPYDLVEVLNGILFVSLFWMLLFLVIHLTHAWSETRLKYGGRYGIIRSLRSLYVNFKPEIALFTIVSAFCVRTFVLWYVRWLKNNNVQWSDWITSYSGELLVAFTGLLIVGVMCWIRVISPITGRTAAYLWFVMVTTALSFGVGMHYFF